MSRELLRLVTSTRRRASRHANAIIGLTIGCNNERRVISTIGSLVTRNGAGVARTSVDSGVCASPSYSLVVHPDNRRHLSGFLL